MFFDNLTETGQELDRERVGERVREPLGEEHPDSVRPAYSEGPARGVGSGVAELLGCGKDPLAQLR